MKNIFLTVILGEISLILGYLIYSETMDYISNKFKSKELRELDLSPLEKHLVPIEKEIGKLTLKIMKIESRIDRAGIKNLLR